jgi:hypothetical protein
MKGSSGGLLCRADGCTATQASDGVQSCDAILWRAEHDTGACDCVPALWLCRVSLTRLLRSTPLPVLTAVSCAMSASLPLCSFSVGDCQSGLEDM